MESPSGKNVLSAGACSILSRRTIPSILRSTRLNYRLQDVFSASGWTPTRSTIDYQTDLAAEAIEELPREIPEVNKECSRSMRLIEKMHEAQRKGDKSLGAKMWAYSGGTDAPYDVFDFRVSRLRDGPAELLESYSGHVMANCHHLAAQLVCRLA